MTAAAEGQQLADIERGQRIKTRREDLHLTQPAVVETIEALAWELPRSNALHPETAAEARGEDRPKAPITLRGLQTWEGGGGIAWEKAKLLARALQMDVQFMLNGGPEEAEPTPDPFPPANTETALVEVLAAIQAQLGEQTQVLSEVKDVLVEVKAMLGKDTETADRLEAASETLGGAAAQLDAHLRQVVSTPISEPPRKRAPKRKTAPKRIPRA